jgi:endonuclease/exonuclease/phosphatase (EEP) superfamily protein YafD
LGYVGLDSEPTGWLDGARTLSRVHGGDEVTTIGRPDRRVRPSVELAGWVLVAVVGAVLLTQAAQWTPLRAVAILQALTPYFGLALVPVVATAIWMRRRLMVATCAAISVGAVALALPLAVPAGQPDPRPGSIGLSIAAVNLYFRNDRVDEVTDDLATLGTDVIVFTETTGEHRETLLASPLADDYPYRVEGANRLSLGVAIWSRLPIAERPEPTPFHVDVDVTGPDETIRLLAFHLPTPTRNFEWWRQDLDDLADQAGTFDGPTIVIGDLNATHWHPGFRRVLDTGLVDAHAANGRGFSTSWPTDRFVPPFVRLDHALTTNELVSTSIDDIEIVGSDHRGFVVTVSPAR